MSRPLRLLCLVVPLLSASLPAQGQAESTPSQIAASQIAPSQIIVPDAPMSDSIGLRRLEPAGSLSPAPVAFDDDLLCAHAPAGTVKPLPAPFKFWMVLVCAPQAQAFVPVEGMVWFAHGSTEPVSVLALPPGVAPLPRTADYNPSYNVRFKSVFASEARGAKRARAIELLDAAQAGGKQRLAAKEIERVYQLDAVSSIYDMRYNIYFYVRDNLPRAGLICIDACRQMLLVDILDDEEAQARLAKP